MPCPIRLGPPPRIMILRRFVGFASHSALVRRVQVRRGRLEFRPAGIDHLIDRIDPLRLAVPPHIQFRDPQQHAEIAVAETVLFGLPHQRRRSAAALPFPVASLDSSSIISLCCPETTGRSSSGSKISSTETSRRSASATYHILSQQLVRSLSLICSVDEVRLDVLAGQAIAVDLQRPDGLLHRLLERPADRHRLADGFHLDRQLGRCLREFLERESRPLDHAVVDRRLKARRRLLRDVVGNLVERDSPRPAATRSWRSENPSPSTPAPNFATRAGSSR